MHDGAEKAIIDGRGFVIAIDELDTYRNGPGKQYVPGLGENIIVYKYSSNPGTYDVDYGWRKISTQESFFNLFKPNDSRINQWIVGPQYYTDENGDQQQVPDWSDEPMDITPHINDLFDATDDEGVMNVVRASGDFTPVAKSELGEKTFASPAISDGQLFLRSDKHLFCIGNR